MGTGDISCGDGDALIDKRYVLESINRFLATVHLFGSDAADSSCRSDGLVVFEFFCKLNDIVCLF